MIEDYKIPIILNNFNRLKLTKRLAEDLYNLGYRNIHILDNNSTYPRLLEWYDSKECNSKFIVKRLGENLKALSIYNSGYINNWLDNNSAFGKQKWIAYTDSDLVLSPLTPKNFIYELIRLAEKYGKTKAGLALQIYDLPNNPYADHYKNWETKYWQQEIEKNVYEAHIDTTFCVIKPGLPFDYGAIRVGGNMTAIHQPWYTDFNNLDEEEKYYLEHCTENSTYKRYYNNEIMKLAFI
jgi:hypothetical protein